jgi:hypothetical protein
MTFRNIFLPKDTLYVKGDLKLMPIMTYGSSSFFFSNGVTCNGDCVVGKISPNCGSLDPNKFPYYVQGDLKVYGNVHIMHDKMKTKIEI